MMVVVDAERGEIKTENLSGGRPRKRMVFHIEEMKNSMVEGRKLGPRNEFFSGTQPNDRARRRKRR
jgi:hypothetical protein